ncbi:MAG: hypothetical protein JEZ08_02960 [Clostridiales bacterium]|nr:hypothetical protein [Clostridiales bacterium]
MKILSKIFPEMKQTKQVVIEKKEPTTAYSYEEKKIKEIFDKNGEPLTAEKMEEVKAFLSETEGDLESKLATVETSLEKDVEITKENLKAVHTAIHKDIDMKDVLPEMPARKVYNSLSKEIKAEIKPLLDAGMSLEGATKVMIQGKLTELLFPEKEMVEVMETAEKSKSEPTQSENSIELPEVEKESNEVKTERTIESSLYFEETDEPLEIIEEIFEVLSESLEEVAEWIAPVIEPELLETKLPVRKLIETEMTVKMAETKQTFDMYQKGIDSQLNQIIESPKPVEMKEVLSQVIDKLDHIIMKTDVPLYTDMKTERDLLVSSGELERAREFLDKEPEKAIKIIKEVKELVSQINYRPVKQKIYGVTKDVLIEKLYDEQLIKTVPFKIANNMQISPRAVLETLRGMGINHESEVTELLSREGKELKAPANMKAILMKLEETSDQRIQAKDTLENLTGQQLMNKLEIKSHKQQLLFNVPININNDVKHLKVHVNAKKDNQKIDWKNSRLYFVIHLDKLGDTGVLVDVNNGQVNVTIKNDNENLEQQMKPYVDESLKRLEDVGFTTSNIKFEPLHKEKETKTSVKEGFEVRL